MKKFAIIFLVFALAIAAQSKSHRFFDFSGSSSPSSGSFSFPSAPSSGSSPDFSFLDFFQPQQESYSPIDVLQSLIRDDSARLQRQINFFGEGISEILTNSSSQEMIRNFTSRARNIAALLDVSVVRENVDAVIDEAFDSLEAIRGELINGLVAVKRSNSSINSLKNFLTSYEPVLLSHLQSLNETILSAFQNITEAHKNELTLADQETIDDVQSLLGLAVVESQNATTEQVNKLIVIAKILSLQGSVLSNTQRNRLEREVRNQANQLVRDLRALNITNLHGVASQVTNYLLDQIETLQNNTISLADRALESPTPGNVLNDAFLNFKAGLGRSIINFKRRAERAIIKFIRDTLQSLNIRNIRGASIQDVLESARARVTARLNEINSLITRVSA